MPTPEHHPPTDPESWVNAYGDYLFRYALSRLRNPDEAQNMVQETFLAALKSRDSFAGRSAEKTWLVGILKHKILDHYRRSYREKPVSDLQENDDAVNSFFDQTRHLKKRPTSWVPDPEEVLENKEFWQAFQNCLARLPKVNRDAFAFRELEKMDGKEICRILNITSSNYWVLMHRARLQLRQCLEENWFEKC